MSPQNLLTASSVILDSLSDGVYVCDTDRKIVYWSKAAERITGWSAGRRRWPPLPGRRALPHRQGRPSPVRRGVLPAPPVDDHRGLDRCSPDRLRQGERRRSGADAGLRGPDPRRRGRRSSVAWKRFAMFPRRLPTWSGPSGSRRSRSNRISPRTRGFGSRRFTLRTTSSGAITSPSGHWTPTATAFCSPTRWVTASPPRCTRCTSARSGAGIFRHAGPPGRVRRNGQQRTEQGGEGRILRHGHLRSRGCASKTLSLRRGGSPPVVIFRSGGEVEQIESPGMPFGVMEDYRV